MIEWVEIFLNVCISQANKNINKIDSVNTLYEDIILKLRRMSNVTTIIDVIDIIFKFPIFIAGNIRDHLDISAYTLNNYLNKLCENNIIYSDRGSTQ